MRIHLTDLHIGIPMLPLAMAKILHIYYKKMTAHLNKLTRQVQRV